MPFALKKFFSQFLMPVPMVCELFLLGWVINRFTRYKRTGIGLKFSSLCFFLLFGYGCGRTYLEGLERQYPPFEPTKEQCRVLRGVPVVVLGQGMPEKSDLPLRYQNTPIFERRLFEGVRVAKLIEDSILLVSMTGKAADSAKQNFLFEYLQQVNFPTNRVAIFTTAQDTVDEAKLAKQMIFAVPRGRILPSSDAEGICTGPAFKHSFAKDTKLLLATSAAHIPRAMIIFKEQGLSPIAAPCDYTQIQQERVDSKWYILSFPTARNLDFSTNAMHEWLGGILERIL